MPNALVVDDEEDIADAVKDQLEMLDFTVFTANSGEKACELLRQHPFVLGVIDMKLSTSMTGIDVIRVFRELHPQAVVIAMTGYMDITMEQEAKRLGAAAYLMKPDDIIPARFMKHIAQYYPKAVS